MINKNSTAIAAGFIVMGLLIGYPGVMVQKASAALSLDVTQKATLLAVQFWGCAGGIFVGMLISEIIGKKRFLHIGALLIALGFGIGIAANSYLLLLISFLIAGAGLGFYESGFNAMCLDYVTIAYPATKAQSTSLFHFFFGLGAIISPILIEAITMAVPLWNGVFIFFLPVPLICSILLFRTDNFAAALPETAKAALNPRTFLTVALFLLASALYVGAETTVYGWLPIYWDSLESASTSIRPGFAVSLFWITFSLGRLAGGPVVSKLGDGRYVITVSAAAILLSIVWALFGMNLFALLVYIALAGLLLACIFPTLLVSFDRALPGMSGTVSGLFLFFGTLSAAIFPSVSGAVFKKGGMALLPLFWCGVLAVFLAVCGGAFLSAKQRRGA